MQDHNLDADVGGILLPMEFEPKWLVLYLLALEAEHKGWSDLSDVLIRRALEETLKTNGPLAHMRQGSGVRDIGGSEAAPKACH